MRRTHEGRVALWAALSIGLVMALFVAVLATRDSAQDKLAASPLLGKPAPELAGTSIDGRDVRLSALGGHWVLVNFFATWCTPCLREHPELVTFTQRHRARGDASVVAVIWDDDADAVRRFFERQGGDWPVIPDNGGRVALDFGVRGPPESFLIDPRGFVVSHIVGEVTADGLDQLLRRAEAQGA